MPTPDIPINLPAHAIDTFFPPETSSLFEDGRQEESDEALLPTWDLAAPSDKLTPDAGSTRSLPAPELDSEVATAAPRKHEAGAGQDTHTRQGYSLIERVGTGGMGEVWAAIQSTLERPVAVKRMLTGRRPNAEGAGHVSASEFRQEAMVAGRLEHPNIVPIHDLGSDEQGRPLIAMKLVEGTTWSDQLVADFGVMSAPDFLGKHLPILAAMASAVAFAHDRGVVHRDLKPSQVMVGEFGETLLMDWGLALSWKDTQRRHARPLALPTPATAGNPAGTPALMAPEQTQQDARNVGPHTDVFLLGGTLYFLLTGSYPYSAPTSLASFMRATAYELDEPQERAPDRWIPKELAEIAMRAMRRRPADRFASANEFRVAITDWMTGAAQRREAAALLEQARTALDTSPASYEAFDDVAHLLGRANGLWPDQPGAIEATARAKEGYARLALRAHDLTLARAQAVGMPEGSRRTLLLAQIEDAAERQRTREWQRRAAIVSTIALLLLVIAGGAIFIGRLNRLRAAESQALAAEKVAREESNRQRDRATEARKEAEGLIGYMLGDLTTKLQPIGRLDVMDSVLIRVDDLLTQRRARGITDNEREVMVDLLLKTFQVRLDQGNLVEADAVVRRAMEEMEILADSGYQSSTLPKMNAAALYGLALVYVRQGNLTEARASMVQYIEMVEEFAVSQPNDSHVQEMLGVGWGRLGDTLVSQGNLTDARAAFDRNLQVMQRLVESDPENTKWRLELGTAWGKIGDADMELGNIEQSLTAFENSTAAFEELVAFEPKNTTWQETLGLGSLKMGDLFMFVGETEKAKEAYEGSLRALRALAALDPANATWQYNLANAWSRVGDSHLKLRNIEGARAAFLQSCDVIERLVEADPSNIAYQQTLGAAYGRLGTMYLNAEELPEARQAFERNLDLTHRIAQSDPMNMSWRRELSVVWSKMGDVQASQEQMAEARTSYNNGLEILESVVATDPSNVAWQRDLGMMMFRIGFFLHQDNDRTAGDEMLDRAVAILEQHDTDGGRTLAKVKEHLAKLEKLNAERDAKAAAGEDAVTTEPAVTSSPGTP